MDVGTFELKSGTVTFLGLVNRCPNWRDLSLGQGHFTLKAARAHRIELELLPAQRRRDR